MNARDELDRGAGQALILQAGHLGLSLRTSYKLLALEGVISQCRVRS